MDAANAPTAPSNAMTPSPPRILLGIPVFNEERYVSTVLDAVLQHLPEVLVVDDGSTDATPALLAAAPVRVVRHERNRGYGAAMRAMLDHAAVEGFDWLIVMDCDEQHEPAALPHFIAAIEAGGADVVSGSRYLDPALRDHAPPSDRQAINAQITSELNLRLGLRLTDSFCGFKAYRVATCRSLQLDVDGYEFPMQFWVQAVAAGLRIREIPVRLIYNDLSRTFGGPLDHPRTRLRIYLATLARELIRCHESLPLSALIGLGLRGRRRSGRFGIAIQPTAPLHPLAPPA
jgi:glycosyltransferase involved in cell wall biosynthesis